MHQPVLAAGVDDDLGAHVAHRAVLVLDRARRRRGRPRTARRARARLRARRRRARGRCRASSDRTRCAPPARSASTRAACCPRSRTAPRACPLALTNCTLYFLTKWLCCIFGSMFSRFEHPVGFGNQRLADVEARKVLALEELDAIALLGDQRRDRGAGRPAADDDDIRICVRTCRRHAPTTPPRRTAGPSSRTAAASRLDDLHRHGQPERLAKLLRRPRGDERRRSPACGASLDLERQRPHRARRATRSTGTPRRPRKRRTTDSIAAG